MRRYVINLTRLGDLLQTQPVIQGLVDQGDQVALVCLENFAGAAALLRGLEHVAALPGAALLAAGVLGLISGALGNDTTR